MVDEVKNENKLKLEYQFKDRANRLKFITRVSMFSALAFVFYAWFKIPVVILFPSFLKLSISMVFLLIGAFSTGPLGALILCIVRCVLKLIISPADEPVGEIIDLLLALIVTVPSSFYYMNHYDKKGGYKALLIAFVFWIVGSFLLNAFFIDWYVMVSFKKAEDAIPQFISMIQKYIPSINEENYRWFYALFICVPFNLLNGFINCGLTALVYKKISVLLRKIGK